MQRPILLSALTCLILAGCASPGAFLPDAVTPSGLDPRTRPFVPVSDYPVPPNVERLIGPEDCQGATLSAQSFELPRYPSGAYSRGRQGWVVVRFHVYDDGLVRRARVARAVPPRAFNSAALGAVRDWRFEPLPEGTALSNCVVLFEFRMGEVRIR